MAAVISRPSLDGWAVGTALFLSLCGLSVLAPLGDRESGELFIRQIIWVLIGLAAMTGVSLVPMRFLAHRSVVLSVYAAVVLLLLVTEVVGSVFQGAQSWLNFGFAALQPAELAKIAVVLVLAKYLARRHVAISQWRHVVVSAAYVGVIALLVLTQPDLGSAVVLGILWLVMVLAAGIPLRSLMVVTVAGVIAAGGLWVFALSPYQKERVITFLSPSADVLGAGYSSRQALIAIGSGGVFGKGVGFGTQSRLSFLPEYETDFIFAAFAEEWGFVGVMVVLLAFGFLVVRVVRCALASPTNFGTLVALGCAAILVVPFALHTLINIGLLPVTGLALPFMSYGGSHTLVEWMALGIAMAAARGR
ncbi:MAG: rod shape-determining protein RodA [Candidatus Parcubacteria bacterium]|nr:MAG: rod shape-determining protein RodA [Candidatus Parcubacteria bacterium]